MMPHAGHVLPSVFFIFLVSNSPCTLLSLDQLTVVWGGYDRFTLRALSQNTSRRQQCIRHVKSIDTHVVDILGQAV